MTTRTRPLRTSLAVNAAFSTGCGAWLLLRPDLIAVWLDIELIWLFRVIGVGLLLFAADLAHQATRPRLLTWRALYASLADFAWVIGSVVLILLGLPATALGQTLVIVVAGCVFAFGCWQLWAIGVANRQPEEAVMRTTS